MHTLRARMFISVCLYVSSCMDVCLCMYVHACAPLYECMCVCLCVHVLYKYLRACVSTFVYAPACACVSLYVRALLGRKGAPRVAGKSVPGGLFWASGGYLVAHSVYCFSYGRDANVYGCLRELCRPCLPFSCFSSGRNASV